MSERRIYCDKVRAKYYFIPIVPVIEDLNAHKKWMLVT